MAKVTARIASFEAAPDASGVVGVCECQGLTFSMCWLGGEVKATCIGGTQGFTRYRYAAADICRSIFMKAISERTTEEYRKNTAALYA